MDGERTAMASVFDWQFAEQAPGLLSAILEQSQECILLINRAGAIEYINGPGRVHLGIGGDTAMTVDGWLEYWPPVGRNIIADALASARAGQPARAEICTADDRTGTWCDLEVSPIHDRAGQQSHLLVIARDITHIVAQREEEQRRRQAAEREAVLSDGVAREMRHRFKNQLAVISSLLRISARTAVTIPDLTDSFEQRLAALGRAQDFLAVHRGEPMQAGQAISDIVQASGAGERVRVGTVPDAHIAGDGVQSLALILGELQTNALKHGALSVAGGSVELNAAQNGGHLAVRWSETGGPPVTAPAQPGGGLKLLDRMGAVGGAKPIIHWRREGMDVTFYVRLVPTPP